MKQGIGYSLFLFFSVINIFSNTVLQRIFQTPLNKLNATVMRDSRTEKQK